jgi:hypothetical protein
MSQCCGKIPTEDDVRHIRESFESSWSRAEEYEQRRREEEAVQERREVEERESREEEKAAQERLEKEEWERQKEEQTIYVQLQKEENESRLVQERQDKEKLEENKREAKSREARGRGYQGDLGEWAIGNEAVDKFHLVPVCFDKRIQGFDGVYSTHRGELVILESKFTDKSGKSALGNPSYGKETSVEWVTNVAKMMCDPNNKTFYTPDNAKIGETILKIGADKVKLLLGHKFPDTPTESDFEWLR